MIRDILNYFSYNSVVILSYFLICFIVFVFNVIFKGKINELFMCKRGSILNPLTYIRMVTSGFCHNDFNHFKNNFLMILLIGPMIEEKYGSIPILKMILITTFISGLVHTIFYSTPSVGASDNVYMLATLGSIVNVNSGKIPISLVLIFLFFLLSEIINLFFRKDNISHDGHIVGAICGILFGYSNLI